MYLYLYVEEPSVKIVIDHVLKKMNRNDISHYIYIHQGKEDLKNGINKTISTISRIPNSKILILIDQDNEDCRNLKQKLNALVAQKSLAPTLIRIVCRELETWFLGDLNAINKAYPRFNPRLYVNKKLFRNVDLIKNSSNLLLKIIPEYNDRNYLPKIEVAENIAPFLEINDNSSASFKHFISGIERLLTI